jgi:flagellar hook-associated protein 1 FlgK
VVTGGAYQSGQAITYTPTPGPGPGFAVTFTGAPSNGDSVAITQNPYAGLNGGNATEIMNLRDVALFDGAAMTDGYAGLISQLGIRAQSANYSAEVSTNIAVNAEKARSGVSGVNLDEEAARLLQYQQAYQASAKMIQIAQSVFDTLIQGLGR